MKQRELLRLPLGDYCLTDGICDYILTKHLSYSGTYAAIGSKNWYSLRKKGSLTTGSISAIGILETIQCDGGVYTKTILSFHAHVAGITVPVSRSWNPLHNFKFKPRSSYKQWLINLQQK